MKALAQKITSHFIAKDIIEKSKRELCEYVIQTKLLFILTMSVIMVMSIIYGSVFETAIYLSVVLKLRKHLGGYHVNSEFFCFLLSIISTVIIVNFIIPVGMKIDSIIFLGVIGICTSIMWYIPTINHPSAKMTGNEIKANIKIAKYSLITLIAIAIISYIFKYAIVIVVIAIGEMIVLGLMLISKILKQEVK